MSIELEKGNTLNIHFEQCNEETCIIRLIDGYAVNEKTKEKIDIFQKLLIFDHVYFLFGYPDGSHKSVGIPLYSFKEQYNTI